MTQGLEQLSMAIGLASARVGADDLEWWRAQTAQLLKRHFLAACIDVDVDVLLEVGAHAAETSIAFVEQGGKAFAYEANPHTFSQKTKLAENAGVEVRNLAVGRSAGTAEMRIPLWGGDDPSTPGNASLLEREADVDYEVVSVPVTTLDAAARELPEASRVALWVDVEGLAVEVLQGGEALLREQCRLVLVEVEATAYWKGQFTASAVDAVMRQFGFAPLARDAEYQFQYNLLYARESLVGALDERIAMYWRDAGALLRVRPSYPAYRKARARAGSVARLLKSGGRGIRTHDASHPA